MGILSWLFADKYAKRFMATPSFSAKLGEVNKKLKEGRDSIDARIEIADVEFKKSDTYLHCRATIEECNGDEDAGWDLYIARVAMMNDFNVTWEVACQAMRTKTDIVANQLRNLKKETR